MNILYIIDKVLNHYDNMKPLLEQHSDEIALYKSIMKVSPDLATYKMLDDADLIYGVFAYIDGQLVGYSVNIIMQDYHYDLLCATNDLLFVDKDYRKSRIGLSLLRKSEEEAKKRGASIFLQKASPNTPLSRILDILDSYDELETTYTKVL